jgi:alpha-L-fucosidase 2
MKRRSFILQTAAFLTTARKLVLAKEGSSSQRATPRDGTLRLWYDTPAADWNQALPLGSGRLGAMIFGGADEEHLQLNEDTLVSEEPGTSDLPLDVTKQYDAVVGLLRKGRYAEASDLITKNWTGRSWPCYQPMSDVFLSFAGHDLPSKYNRELDLSNAISRVTYSSKGIRYTREYFASFPDQLIVARLTANKPRSLSFRLRLTSPHPTAKTTSEGQNALLLTGQAPGLALRRSLEWIEDRGEQWKYPEVWDKNGNRRPNASTVLYGEDVGGRGMFFATRLQLTLRGGTSTAANGEIHVDGADEAVIRVSAATSFDGFGRSPSRSGIDPAKGAAAYLSNASSKDYNTLRSRHVADHRRLFDRVSVEIGSDTEQSRLPTDRRIAQFATGNDPTLPALYLQFARYLTIAASRPGSQPLNLQGMWNDQVVPPWACGYTTNINVEMNYWPVDLLNLSECFEPLERLIQETNVNGAHVARTMYKRRGSVLHHNTTIWRGAQPVDNNALPAFWNVGQGWLCQHLWDHYQFTGDKASLERSYPVMISAAAFLCDWLVEDANGHLVTSAGVSPENTFYYVDPSGTKKKAGVCMGPTMDIAITRQVFQNCLRAAAILGKDDALLQELQAKLPRLLPYQIGGRGQLQEWPIDFEEVDPHHRHVSHLFGIYPDHQIDSRAPELMAAARRSLELRGDEGTGWSRAWKICLWARFQDGNHAYKLITNLFKPSHNLNANSEQGGLMPNMFCSCPPMQIDGNFGGAAGIAEMLLQSHEGIVHLLPALPDQWPNGTFRGLRARNGFEVALEWKKGKLTWAEISSAQGGQCRIRYGTRTVEATIKPGTPYRFSGTA